MITSVLQAVWMGLKGAAETVANTVAWAFKPANRFKAMALLLGIAASVLLVRLIDARKTIIVVQEKARADVVAIQAQADKDVATAVGIAEGWRTKYGQLSQMNADAIREATERQREAQESDKKIIAELKARAERAEKSAPLFFRNLNNASQVCKATIDALPVNCKELGTLK